MALLPVQLQSISPIPFPLLPPHLHRFPVTFHSALHLLSVHLLCMLLRFRFLLALRLHMHRTLCCCCCCCSHSASVELLLLRAG